jgi:hypothetical protein
MALPENKITLEDIKAVVYANPDKKNPGANKEAGFAECKYFAGNGAASCVFGHVFKSVGVKEADLDSRHEGIYSFADLFALPANKLEAMQDNADSGLTWRESFELVFGVDVG